MSNYKRLIDEAMKTAQYRLNAGIDKTASSPNQSSLVKEASELANALEYMSMQHAHDGSLAGQARAEIIRDFHKAATAQRLGVKLAGDVGESSTHIQGVQNIAPASGKTKLMPKKEVNGNPMVTSSPDSTGHTMLESYKQADTDQTLYDILMHQKEAGDVGEMDATMPAPNIPSSNENSNRGILNDAYVLQGVSKQEAKAPVRARLQEAFASTSDTLGDSTVKAMFPMAYQKGGLKKVASIYDEDYYDFLEKEAMKKKKKHHGNKGKRSKQRREKSSGKNKRKGVKNYTPPQSPKMPLVVQPKPEYDPSMNAPKQSKPIYSGQAPANQPLATQPKNQSSPKKYKKTKGANVSKTKRIVIPGKAVKAVAGAGAAGVGYLAYKNRKRKQEMQKAAMSEAEYQAARERALIGGGVGGGLAGILGAPIGAAIAAPEGQKARAAGYGALGAGAGAIGGGLIGGRGLAILGGAAGGGLGARQAIRKEASVAELSAYADLIEQGHFGEEAQHAFDGMTSAIDSYVTEDLSEKTASAYETDYNIYDENAARLARLNNLLKNY